MIQMTVIGHIGKDAETKQVKGKTVTNFSLAINEKSVNTETGEVTEKTIWVKCAIWRNEAGKLPQYLKRGQQVFAQGTPDFKIYKKEDKTPGLDITLRVDKLELLGGKKDTTGAGTATDGDWSFDDQAQNSTASNQTAEDEAFWSSTEEQEKAANLGEKIMEGVKKPFAATA